MYIQSELYCINKVFPLFDQHYLKGYMLISFPCPLKIGK